MSKSSPSSCSANSSAAAHNVLEIEQCLFPVPEEFFMKTPKAEECISVAFSESLGEIPKIPSYTRLEDLLSQGFSTEVIDKLCFNEMLLISADNDEIVGGLAVQVETIADEVVAVFCSSHFSMGEDRTARSELLALTDKQFNPFQERKCETVLAGDLKQEKQLQLYFEEDQSVTAFRQETVADKCESFEGTLNAGEDGLLVPDGLNILFMRYLVYTGFTGEIHTRTIDIEGRIGHSLYQISHGAPIEIDGALQNTMQVIRTIFYSDTDEPEISTSLYLTTGHLVRHAWNNSKYSIILNPRQTISEFPIDVEDLCTTMRIYLEELAKLLEGAPQDPSSRSSIAMQKQSQIVRAVLSEILRDATEKAAAVSRRPSECSMTSTAIRDVLVDLINQMSIM
ncbi:uncharacterized protein LOC5569508 [Aedes aegypti]|uniref:Ciliogenesis-associated TTC17-interacting protein N-terminal domain-containing protein n=1 Tax=Aedes aegypti TaxID=7159 RepID=A0A1S4FHC9_AEDAE|nr:uncharacterized protein LOC5569508 [Aedes aegypti]